MITKGQIVKIKPEWVDAPEELEMKCLVLSGEEIGKPRITIEYLIGLSINPTSIVDVKMVEVIK